MKADMNDLLERLRLLQAVANRPSETALPTWEELEEMEAIVDEAWARLRHVAQLIAAAERLAADIEEKRPEWSR